MKIIKRLIRTVIVLGIIFFILIGLPMILFHMDTAAPLGDYNDTQETVFFQSLDDELSFTVGETELTDYLYDVKPTLAALLKVVYKESLLTMDISDDGFDIQLRLGALRRLLTDPDEPVFTRWESEADKAVFMTDLGLQAVQGVINHPLDPYIELSEADLNSILDYTLDEDVQFDVPFVIPLLGDEIEYSFASTNLFVRLNDDELSIHLLMSLTREDLAGSFDMQFN